MLIRASAQAAGDHQEMMTSYYRPSITGLPEMGLCARQLYNTTGLGATDFQTAIIYDHFTPLALPQFEEFGFCKRGEAKDFVANGNIELGGGLPINTNGGQLGEAYIHGMNGIAEGVRQVRGTSVNQVAERRARARDRGDHGSDERAHPRKIQLGQTGRSAAFPGILPGDARGSAWPSCRKER